MARKIKIKQRLGKPLILPDASCPGKRPATPESESAKVST
jgi:hypothetical protein